jgi:hypothetical protein
MAASRPGAHTGRSSDITEAFSNRFFTGGHQATPDTQLAPFKRPFMPGYADVPVAIRKLNSKTRPSNNVLHMLHLKTNVYGNAAFDEAKLRLLLPHDTPIWVSKRYEKIPGKNTLRTDNVEVRSVADINRTSLVQARSNRGASLVPMSYTQFSQIWAPMGVPVSSPPASTISQAGGTPTSVITVFLSGQREIVNLWLNWHPTRRLAIHQHVWLIFVARTVGYEDVERRFMLEGNPGGFVEHFRKEERRRQMLLPYHAKQAEHIMSIHRRHAASRRLQGDASVVADDELVANPAIALSGDSNLEHSMLPALPDSPFEARRYTRWEPYVTDDRCEPPTWVYNTVDPRTGELHRGKPRHMGEICKHHPEFSGRNRWESSTEMLLYGDPEKMGSSLTPTSTTFNNHPKVMVCLETPATI